MNRDASSRYAVIGDLVASRDQPSRAEAQRSLVSALATVNDLVASAPQPLEPTIGDELQGVYADLHDALLATVLVRLALPETMDCRFGVGVGTLEIVGESNYGLTQDGPAWWSARTAIDTAKDKSRHLPGLRTWIVRDGTKESDMANAYLLMRDELVSGFDARQRRIALGVVQGRTRTQLAEQEGISVSAVSQRHRAGIGALIESIDHLPMIAGGGA
ncbi:MAG: SatD family protein [Aeromicrobium sp.]